MTDLHPAPPPRLRPRLPSTAILLLAAGCGGDDSRGSFTHRDSAGITIVESTVPAWGRDEGWTVGPTPLLDLADGEGPDHEFFSATDADRLSDGALVVGDDGEDEIRLFSPAGEYVRTLGRDGDGPGEFRRLDQVIALPGDSILAYDFWQARVTVFAPDGGLARIVTLQGAYRPRPLFPVKAGGFVGLSRDVGADTEEIGYRRGRNRIVRVGPDGVVSDTLAAIAGHESVLFSRGDGPALWGKSPHIAVRGDLVFSGQADSIEYQVRQLDGRLARIVRVPGYDLTLSEAEIAAEREAFAPDPAAMPPAVLDMVREILQRQPERTHRPGYSVIVVDTEGHIWLEAYRARNEEGEPGRWLVFDPSGRWLGHVTLPPRFEVFRIGTDWILGKRPDELDVEHVQLLRLVRHARREAAK